MLDIENEREKLSNKHANLQKFLNACILIIMKMIECIISILSQLSCVLQTGIHKNGNHRKPKNI